MDRPPLRVGVLHDFPRPDGGASFEWAVRLGIGEVEATGRLPAPVTFVHEPAHGGPDHPMAPAFARLVDHGVLAILGPALTDGALAVRPLADDAGVPCINYAGNDQARSAYLFHFQIGSLEDEPSLLVDDLVRRRLARVALIQDTSRVGNRMAAFFGDAAAAAGCEVAAHALVEPDGTGTAPAVATARHPAPDALAFVGFFRAAHAVAREMRAQGWSVPAVANSALMYGHADPAWARDWEGWTYADTFSEANPSERGKHLAAVQGANRSILGSRSHHVVQRCVPTGLRHEAPGALGLPVREAWNELWGAGLHELFEGVLTTGEAYWASDRPFFLERFGYPEETFFDVSYDPVRDESGRVAGVFCIVSETTGRVIGERRLRTLREVGARMTAEAKSAEEACHAVAHVLAENQHDVPFALIYLLGGDSETARLVGSAGLPEHCHAAPHSVTLTDASGNGWPFREVLESGVPQVVSGLVERFGPVSSGVWPEPVNTAVVLPVTQAGQDGLAAFLVAGVTPRRVLDDQYRGFLDLLAGQLGTTIANARAYEAERKCGEALAELDRVKTAFFSNVSHEFRTPLTLMLGPLEDALAGTDEALGPRTAERLDVAHRNSLRLLKLVNTLLDFSRIEAGRIQAVYEETDIAAFTTELASVFRSAVERAGLSLEVSCEKIEAPVYVDREMWEKVVLNLLSNAFKFTLSGGIVVTAREHGMNVVVSVRDTGTGIPADELPQVFERFHRVRGARGRTDEGTGIGLALVQELVKLHGGTVSVESGLGRGTTFTVSLPTGSAHLPKDRLGGARTLASTALGAAPYVEDALRWLPDEAARALHVEDTRAAGVRVSTAGARVLLADDNYDMREYLRRLLTFHWEVEAVADGDEALSAIQRARPDLVLSDVMMPRRDGFGLLEAIREDPSTRTLPVILLSARAGEEARVEGLDAGADDYLIKPFSARELIARVNTHLELARVRREAQARLEESEERFRNMADHAPVMMWVTEPSGSGAYRNARWYEFTGQTPETGLGMGWLEAVHPEDRERAREVFLAASERREPFRLEYRLRRAAGEYRWAIDAASPRFGAAGEFLGYIGSVIDISDRKLIEDEREQLLKIAERARGEAEGANQAKDEFLAVLSHELRSPMNAMLGWLRILKTAGTRDPDLVGKAVVTLERNIWVQAQVINDLLDVSRILSGKLQLDEERLELSALMTGCVESLRPLAEGKQVALRLNVKHDDVEIIGDSARLQQVVSNLVGNAIKFTDAGGFVTVTLDRGDATATLTVEDTGQGIAAEFLPHLFERFRQADSTASRRHGGLGLGLSIVKHIVTLHEGQVAAESAGVGRGSRFSVVVPLAGARQRVAFRVSSAAAPPVDAALPPLNVLLVEDDADTRHALELTLEEHGSRVRSAASVRQALEAYNTRPPDVIISDIGMPGEDGYVLIRAIRELEEGRNHRTLAIAMTGFASRQDHETALRAGFDEHIPKPVEPDVLFERLRVLAASRGHDSGGR